MIDVGSATDFPGYRRAQRFAIAAPVRYRRKDGLWFSGLTIDLSRSGVLFAAETAMAPGTRIEVLVDLPPAVAERCGAQVAALGTVARQDGASGAILIAAKFDGYSLRRQTAGAGPD